MANGVDPDQAAPIGAVCSGAKLFASILNLLVMQGNYLRQTTSADNFSRQHFQMHFFLGALRANTFKQCLHYWLLDKYLQSKITFHISNTKHMLWVLKRTVSMRRFF